MANPADSIEGIVTNVSRSRCLAQVSGSQIAFHVPGGLIRKNGGRNPARVGDRVMLTLRSGTIVLDSILPRQSQLQRTHTEEGRASRGATIATNLALALFVLPASFEPRQTRMLDRMLVGASWAQISAAICINKIDTVKDLEPVRERLSAYAAAGWDLLYTVAPAGDGLAQLVDYLPDGLSAFIGPSGAGKTTLISAITGRSDLKTLGVNTFTGKGRHATTAVSAYQVDQHRWVVDAPGLKTFGVAQAPRTAVRHAFPEIASAEEDCIARWCDHSTARGCRVQAEIRAGRITRERLGSFKVLLAEAQSAN